METLILCGIYLAELTCFQFGVRILFDVQQKENAKIWMLAGIIFPIVISKLSLRATGKNFLVTIAVVSIMFISIQGKLIEKSVMLVLIFLLLECIDDIFAHPIEQIFVFMKNYFVVNIYYLMTKCCTATSTIILYFIKEKMNHKKIHIDSVVYIIIAIIIALMVVCLNILDQVTVYLPGNKFAILSDIINVAIYISIFLLVSFVIYIKKTHERMEQLLETEKLLKESQVNYYKQSLKKEADTRQYRHDMVNHLTYLSSILSQNRTEDAKHYITNILGGFKAIQNTYYTTGNDMVDTIMNYFFGMLPKSTVIDIRGRSPVQIDMEETDLCTIFSNIFQNIADEIIKNQIENGIVKVEIRKGKQYVEYRIQNTTHTTIDSNDIHKNGLPKSHKSDKRNHGIGMTNIKNAVERGKGKFEWSQTDGYFTVTVTLIIK